ncbi:MAG TPA: thiamine pyrophosphate-dependent enzyme, partial [Candidatus Limnocylindrales bacterium]
QAHPDMRALPGIEMSTGSLGQGLSVGVGMVLASRTLGESWRTYVVVGDGEAQEGQIWEASFVAARYGLDGLCGILDWNGLQQYGWRDPNGPKGTRLPSIERPVERWRACGWHALEVDGHDMTALTDAFAEARSTRGRPTMIVARTVKGRGVSFMEADYLWHSRTVTDADLAAALAELGA